MGVFRGLLRGVPPERASQAVCPARRGFLTPTIPFWWQDRKACTRLPWLQPGEASARKSEHCPLGAVHGREVTRVTERTR